MICKKCNRKIPECSVFCSFCGGNQREAESLTMEQMISNIQKLLSVTGYGFDETGKLKCEKWINEFGYDIVCDSVKTALSQYLVKDDEGKYTAESIDEVFLKIGGIARNKYTAISKPYISDVRYITNYTGKIFRFNYYELDDLSTDLNNLLYYFFATNQYDGKVEGILALARGSHDKYEFFQKIVELKDVYDIQ